MGVMTTADRNEEYNVEGFDFDVFRDIVDRANLIGKAERREMFKRSVKTVAEDARLIYDAFAEVGFTDDQAFEFAMAFVEGGMS